MITIAIVNYPASQLSAIYGLVDMFRVGQLIYQQEVSDTEQLHIEVIDTSNELPARQYDFVILPPCINDLDDLTEFSPWYQWFEKQRDGGCVLCSVCAGVYLLAYANLLTNRTVTTHWQLAVEFEQQFSSITLDIDKIIIDDGDIITAGGLMAWTDLGLRIIERVLGPAVMLKTARTFLVDPKGREQRFYRSFSPSFSHGDEQILQAQHWLQQHFSEQVSVEMIANEVNLTERTLLRRFKKLFHMTTSLYIQQLRIEKAKALLELTPHSVDEIAWQVGYQDTNSFRRLFQKTIGLSPTEYRQRFSVNSET